MHDYDKFVSGERTLRSKLVPKRGVTSSDIPDALDSQNTDFAQSAYGVFSIGHENVKVRKLFAEPNSFMTCSPKARHVGECPTVGDDNATPAQLID